MVENRDIPKPDEKQSRVYQTVAFVDKLRYDLIDLEEDIVAYSPGWSELLNSDHFATLVDRQQQLSSKVVDAQRALDTMSPDEMTTISKVDDGEPTDSEKQLFLQFHQNGLWQEKLESVNLLSERIDRRLASRRNSIHTRRTLSVSLIAVLISTASIVFN